MPERPFLRRTLFATVACAATLAFAGSLVGIATTEGKLQSDGATATLAAEQRADRAPARPCPRDHARDERDREVAL